MKDEVTAQTKERQQDDGELARIIREALDAIVATDELPSPNDEGDEAEAGSNAARGGSAGKPKSWGQWEGFSRRVATGEAYVSCVIDFAYTDGGRLRGDSVQLERMYCFHDPAKPDDTKMLHVVHAHTIELWKDRKTLAAGRPLTSFTSVNARYGRWSTLAARNEQDLNKLCLVPKSTVLNQCRSLPESSLAWDLNDDSVPPLDAEFAWRYESVREVLKAGEVFCHGAELAFSCPQSNALMRGTTTRDGQEVEYEVVACMRRLRKDLRIERDHAEVPAAIENVNVAASSLLSLFAVGINEYSYVEPLRNCVSDASAFTQKMKDEGLVEDVSLLTDKSDTTLERLDHHWDEFINKVTSNPPRVIVIFFACHGMQYQGQLYIVPSDANCGQEKLIKRHCVELQDILKELQKPELQNVPKIVILDVCRNSPFLGVGWRITAHSLEQVRLPVNCKLVFSSTAGESAEDGRGRHSPFAQSLLKNFFQRGPTVSQAVDNVCVLAKTRHGQQPTSYGTLPSFHLFGPKETMVFDNRVECPEFSPSGGVFFGETVVNIHSNTSASTVAVRVRGTEAFQTEAIENEPILEPVPPDMAAILENYAFCDLDDKLRFKRILFARYPFVAGANIYIFKPHILITSSKGSNQISDSSLRYTVFVDESSGMPSLRYSSLEERFLVRRYTEGGHADVLELCGSNRVEVLGIYEVMPTRVDGKPAYKLSGGETDMYLTFHGTSSCWHVGHKEGDQYSTCVKLSPGKRDTNKSSDATTADQERGTWFELNEDGEWQENPTIEVVSYLTRLHS